MLGWPQSGLPMIKDTVDYLSAFGIGNIVAVWDTGNKNKRKRRHSSILDNPELCFGTL